MKNYKLKFAPLNSDLTVIISIVCHEHHLLYSFSGYYPCKIGIGGQTALKLIRQHGSIENILENINRER